MTTGEVFNEVAFRYDRVRPGYAQVVLDKLFSMAVLSRPANVLEVGCGTGQLTVPLAHAGNKILAVDPSAELIGILKDKSKDLVIEVECCRFEDWDSLGRQFDLVVSAQAFHWIEPEFGLRKAIACTRSGGAVALLWHVDTSMNSDFYKALQPAFDAFVPTVSTDGPNGLRLAEKAHQYCGILKTLPGAHPPQVFVHKWAQSYSAADYMQLFSTYSFYLDLDELSRSQFYNAVATEAERAGFVKRTYETILIIARVLHA